MSPGLTNRALVSVSDKTGLAEFIAGLIKLGFEIVSTGGTRQHLEDRGIPVIDVSTYTGFPEIMEGRVKTLHPKIHGAILGRPNMADDLAAIREHGIIPFQVIVCNLYPFERTIQRPQVTYEEAIENIDVGGPSMVRAAAKNHAHVLVVTQPNQYPMVLEALKKGESTETLRRELASAAFELTAKYDRAIANYFATLVDIDRNTARFPERLDLSFERSATLRYGENPHQSAAIYVDAKAHSGTLCRAEILHGKELSYNNLLDLDAAMSIVREFESIACAAIKHNNPCGAAVADSQVEAMRKAYAGDPVSAFGSILGFNRPVDARTAEFLCEPDRFIEAVIAPDYDRDAFEMLTTRPKWSKNVRLLKCSAMCDRRPAELEYRSISGGLLAQEKDEANSCEASGAEWRTVSRRAASEQELADLRFAWLIAKHVKSNAIVLAKNGAVVGVGAGQMSRLDSVQIATRKAGLRAKGAVLGSDAFFPFRDGIDEAAQAGITAVVEPGGSRRDDEVLAACDEHGMALVFTAIRHFRH